MSWIHRMSVVGGLAVLAACSSTEPNSAADPNLTLDVATVATELGAQDVEAMHGPGGAFGFGLRPDLGRFSCDSLDREGLTIVRTCTYADADGVAQTEYDSNTTATVTVHTEISGAFDRGRWSATIDRTSDLVVSGLAGANTTMIWNGSGAGTSTKVKTSDSSETRQYDMTFSGTITDVVIPVPRTATSWPLSGIIARDVTVTFTGGPRDGTTVTRSTTLEFNGTQYATLTVNGETFQVDLARRKCHRDHDGHRDNDRDYDDHDGDHDGNRDGAHNGE
jgi:hypothetical protein